MHKQQWPLLAAAAALVFLPALWAGFAADDFTMLLTAHGVHWPLGPFSRNDLGAAHGAGHFYRPLWVLANGAAVNVFGDRPGWLHLLNVALYALVTVEVWALARHFIGRRAWIAGLAFALYPRHVESVAWVSGNTDLLATAFVLGAMLCALSESPLGRRAATAAAFTGLAALTKEIGFLSPALAALALYGLRRPRREITAIVTATAGVLAVVFVARTIAIGGLGGYGDDPVTPARVIGAAGSYAIAAVTPHQLELLLNPWLALIPLGLLGLAAWRLETVWREAHALTGFKARSCLRAVAVGLVWFALALVPVLGQLLDLNNATGERLMFLPSVGLAIAFAALIPARPAQPVKVFLAGLAVAAACLTAFGAAQWVTATDIAERTVAETAALAPPGGEVVLLSFPESYRNAHVFTNGLDRALLRAGHGNTLLSFCLPVQVRDTGPDRIAFERSGPGHWRGTTDASAPFDVPVVGSASSLSPGCEITDPGDKIAPGLARGAGAHPLPHLREVRYAYFDGERVRAVEAGR